MDFGSPTSPVPYTAKDEITYEGMRKVLGGTGSGTPDGLAPYAMVAYNLSSIEDFRTIADPNATNEEFFNALTSILLKPVKVVDKIADAAGAAKDINKVADAVDDAKDTGKVVDKGTDKYDEAGNYTGGRSKAELEKLADDPAHAGSKRPDDINQGLLEQKIGLGLEEKGKLKGPITRDPSGKSEFFDADGQAWDVKSFNSNFKPKKGGYTLQKSMKSIKDSLEENENVILDTTNMTEAHKEELLSEISKERLMDNIILWP